MYRLAWYACWGNLQRSATQFRRRSAAIHKLVSRVVFFFGVVLVYDIHMLTLLVGRAEFGSRFWLRRAHATGKRINVDNMSRVCVFVVSVIVVVGKHWLVTLNGGRCAWCASCAPHHVLQMRHKKTTYIYINRKRLSPMRTGRAARIYTNTLGSCLPKLKKMQMCAYELIWLAAIFVCACAAYTNTHAPRDRIVAPRLFPISALWTDALCGFPRRWQPMHKSVSDAQFYLRRSIRICA